MSTFTKTMVFLAIGSFIALIALSQVGRVLHVDEAERNRGTAATIVKLTAFGLFLCLAYSLVPLLLHVFVIGQGKIGNGELAPIRFLRAHEAGVAFAFWGVCTTGLLIALPVMWTDFFGFEKPLPKTQGVIVANVGLTVAEVTGRSSFKVHPPFHERLTGSSMSTSEGMFDFEIAEGGMRFSGCRYCEIKTGSQNDTKITRINVGISSRKMSRAKLAAEREAITQQLTSAGWLAGHFEYTDPEDITLHGGTRSGDDRYWAKGATLLVLGEKRMDDAQSGEDAATAGEYIHVLDVLPRNDPQYQKLIFGAADVLKN